MRDHQLTSKEIEHYRSLNSDLVKRIHDITLKIHNSPLQKIVSDLRSSISEPFLFVIVGEVKVGKSSFINALLKSEHEICKVAPSPMTDTIQQIIWGKEEGEIQINQYFKKIIHTDEILKEFSIVDTPGTNTIIEHHQEITEQFIPSADMIVFVFDAKNPYRQSAWDFMDVIKDEWKKKIIFVLQQKDLMQDEDLKININGVHDFAIKKGIPEPIIFSVSALQELEGNENSGYHDLRNYIQNNITGGKAGVLKIVNNIDNCINISSKLDKGLQIRTLQYEADLAFGNDLKIKLKHHRDKVVVQVDKLVTTLLTDYDLLMSQKEIELTTNLSFVNVLKRSLGTIFGKKDSLKIWIEQFVTSIESGLNVQLHKSLRNGISDISDNIKIMVQTVEQDIKQSESILKNDNEIFSAIASKRMEVLEDIQNTFHDFLDNSDNFYNNRFLENDYSIAPNMVKGTGVAVIGAMITALTNGIVFDITGGILTAIGLVFAGGSLGMNRRKIVNQYRKQVNEGRQHLEKDVREKLVFYIDDLRNKIQEIFEILEKHLETEKDEINNIGFLLNEINEQLEQLSSDMKSKFSFVDDFAKN